MEFLYLTREERRAMNDRILVSGDLNDPNTPANQTIGDSAAVTLAGVEVHLPLYFGHPVITGYDRPGVDVALVRDQRGEVNGWHLTCLLGDGSWIAVPPSDRIQAPPGGSWLISKCLITVEDTAQGRSLEEVQKRKSALALHRLLANMFAEELATRGGDHHADLGLEPIPNRREVAGG